MYYIVVISSVHFLLSCSTICSAFVETEQEYVIGYESKQSIPQVGSDEEDAMIMIPSSPRFLHHKGAQKGGTIKNILESNTFVKSFGTFDEIHKVFDANDLQKLRRKRDTTVGCDGTEQTDIIKEYMDIEEINTFPYKKKFINLRDSPSIYWIKDAVRLHNILRELHGAQKLKLDYKLAYEAQRQAQYFGHRTMKTGEIVLSVQGSAQNYYRQGESVGARLGVTREELLQLPGSFSVRVWYEEVKRHNWTKNTWKYSSVHFSQIVWKNTKRVGCGRVITDEGATNIGPVLIVVCFYFPPGNSHSAKDFKRNVMPANKTKINFHDFCPKITRRCPKPIMCCRMDCNIVKPIITEIGQTTVKYEVANGTATRGVEASINITTSIMRNTVVPTSQNQSFISEIQRKFESFVTTERTFRPRPLSKQIPNSIKSLDAIGGLTTNSRISPVFKKNAIEPVKETRSTQLSVPVTTERSTRNLFVSLKPKDSMGRLLFMETISNFRSSAPDVSLPRTPFSASTTPADVIQTTTPVSTSTAPVDVIRSTTPISASTITADVVQTTTPFSASTTPVDTTPVSASTITVDVIQTTTPVSTSTTPADVIQTRTAVRASTTPVDVIPTTTPVSFSIVPEDVIEITTPASATLLFKISTENSNTMLTAPTVSTTQNSEVSQTVTATPNTIDTSTTDSFMSSVDPIEDVTTTPEVSLGRSFVKQNILPDILQSTATPITSPIEKTTKIVPTESYTFGPKLLIIHHTRNLDETNRSVKTVISIDKHKETLNTVKKGRAVDVNKTKKNIGLKIFIPSRPRAATISKRTQRIRYR